MSTASESDKKNSFIIFRLGGELYGVPILSVREIFEFQPVKPVPFVPNYYLGIINLRGKIVSIIDLKKKFKMKQNEDVKSGGFIMVMEMSENVIGVVIDETLGVNQVEINEISFNPVSDTTIDSDYLIGATRINDELVTLVDLSLLINIEEIENMKTL